MVIKSKQVVSTNNFKTINIEQNKTPIKLDTTCLVFFLIEDGQKVYMLTKIKHVFENSLDPLEITQRYRFYFVVYFLVRFYLNFVLVFQNEHLGAPINERFSLRIQLFIFDPIENLDVSWQIFFLFEIGKVENEDVVVLRFVIESQRKIDVLIVKHLELLVDTFINLNYAVLAYYFGR